MPLFFVFEDFIFLISITMTDICDIVEDAISLFEERLEEKEVSEDV